MGFLFLQLVNFTIMGQVFSIRYEIMVFQRSEHCLRDIVPDMKPYTELKDKNDIWRQSNISLAKS